MSVVIQKQKRYAAMDEAEVFLWELQRGELEATENNSDTAPSGERPCPICGTRMAVENISGVSIDLCAKHGVWLDRGELPKILASRDTSVSKKYADVLGKVPTDGVMCSVFDILWPFYFLFLVEGSSTK
jgi:hypothetical protein